MTIGVMSQRMFLEIKNKNTSIIDFYNDSRKLQKNIEKVIEELGGTELGSLKTRKYEEYLYMTKGDTWEIYFNMAIHPLKYNLVYGKKPYDNVSAFILLINFNNVCLRHEVYNRLSKIKNYDEDNSNLNI